MHLIFATRGEKSFVDKFINLLQGVFMPFKWRAKADDELKEYPLQMLVQPIQLWSLVFPKEHKDIVLTTLLGKDPKTQGRTNDPKNDKFRWLLQKVMRLEPIPEYKSDRQYPCAAVKEHMEVIGVGLKEDKDDPLGFEAL